MWNPRQSVNSDITDLCEHQYNTSITINYKESDLDLCDPSKLRVTILFRGHGVRAFSFLCDFMITGTYQSHVWFLLPH